MRILRTPSMNWTADQCAAYRGVSRQQWLADVQADLEPKPAYEFSGMPRWNASDVRNWKRPDEWSASECAAYHSISPGQWLGFVARGLAPEPGRRIFKQPVWDQQAVRAVKLASPAAPAEKPRRGRLEALPQKTEWTAAECASYLGVSTAAWRASVQRGEAPQPIRSKGAGKYWDAAQVKALEGG